ncbi:MAG: hypothetical protein M5R40_14770 [Anaerolineae bacterium]|nr:hypothetical protein [Anaerolineae bacterium]
MRRHRAALVAATLLALLAGAAPTSAQQDDIAFPIVTHYPRPWRDRTRAQARSRAGVWDLQQRRE